MTFGWPNVCQTLATPHTLLCNGFLKPHLLVRHGREEGVAALQRKAHQCKGIVRGLLQIEHVGDCTCEGTKHFVSLSQVA